MKGPRAWLVERTAWNVVSEIAAALAFHSGLLGRGERATAQAARIEEWLKGHRRQLLDPVLRLHAQAIREGAPMGARLWSLVSSPGFLVMALPVLITGARDYILPGLDPQSFSHVLITSMLPMAAWAVGRLRVDAEVAKGEAGVAVETARAVTFREQARALDAQARVLAFTRPTAGGVDHSA
jgi:hypothetical protein